MQVSFEYTVPSACIYDGDQITLGLSPDLSREERVSFVGRLKHPLVFRDAMLMLREIVISDMRQKKKDYSDFFAWLNEELDRRMVIHQEYLKGYKSELKEKMNNLSNELSGLELNISNMASQLKNLKNSIENYAIWDNYNKIEHQFWKFIRSRDPNLWMVLDPVITVHPDQVSFEAFSIDESTYGCLSIKNEEFDIVGKPKLGTTNIDFSTKLAEEIERFRTFNDVELSINPEGFGVDTGTVPSHVEKKIDLPETWIKGFNQVSAAGSLGGVEINLSPVDMYDICSFLRRHKAHTSPRSMKWILEPNKRIRIVFEPWNEELKLSTTYEGKNKRIERIWGRRRWLIVEKIIPISESFKIRLLGFGMPQFIIADLGPMKMTIGFTSWSANDWVKGTAFNVMAGFIGEGNPKAYDLLKEYRMLTIEEIKERLGPLSEREKNASIGRILKKGEAYFDATINSIRFRQLLNIPIPPELYQSTKLENDVLELLRDTKTHFSLKLDRNLDVIAESFKQIKVKRKVSLRRSYRYLYDYQRDPYEWHTDTLKTQITFNSDSQIIKVMCGCKEFKKGPRNISAPCSHILALYINSVKYIQLPLKSGRKYHKKELEVLASSD